MKATFFITIVLILLSCIRIDNGREEQKKESYKGIITEIYQEEMNHYMWRINTDCDNNLIGNDWPRSWEYAKIGDSIIKPPDTLMIIIKKSDGTYKEFFYDF
jgi:hypothetical protein